ncbi:hypothetical protein BC940DRAFT_244579 [Gongronella butleri]|nr:hypothetical protein BC940DRAFT_244579 [Gongronella butleri]
MHRDHDDELGRCFQWQPFTLSQPAPGIDASFSSPAFTPASDLSASSSSPPSLPPPRRPSGHCRKPIPRVCSSFSSSSSPQGSAFFLNVFDTQERQRQRDKLRRQHERRCRSSVIKISPVSSSSQSLLSDTSSPASRHACPTLPPLEKPKADTAFFDNARPDLPDHAILPPQWLPPCDAFVNRPSVRVAWKGSPLIIKSLPFYEHLHDEEISIASTLRLTPEQYLRCKRALILSAKVFYDHSVPFRKSDAQKVCRIDVNKTSCLWSAYNRLGWFTPQ